MKKGLLLSIVVVLAESLSAQLKFNHTFDATDFNDPMVVMNAVETVAFDGTTLMLKEKNGSLNWNASYMDFALEGAPLDMSFEVAYNSKSGFIVVDECGYYLPTVLDLGRPMFWLEESADGVTYTATHSWRHSKGEVYNKDGEDCGFRQKSVRLKETTRFVRLGYRANFQGQYRNIMVTPLHSDVLLDVNPRALDFGRMHANSADHTDDKDMELDAYWRNVKDITLQVQACNSEVAQAMYSLSNTTLGNSEIGSGARVVDVTNHPAAAVGDYSVSKSNKNGAYIQIHAATDYANDERIRNIPLSVVLCQEKREMHWYDGQDTIYVGNNVQLDKATTNPTATVSYNTLYSVGDASISSSMKTSAAPTMGVITIKALSAGSGDYADASLTRTFVILPEHGSLYEASLCEGETIEVGGQTITAVLGKTYEVVTLGDSTIFVSMSVHPKREGITTAIKVAEYDLPFKWEGKTFAEAGSQTATLHTRYGCDSVVTMTLSVMPTYYISDTVCQDQFPIYWRHYQGKEEDKDIYDTIHVFQSYESATHVFAGQTGDSAVQYTIARHDTIRMTPDYRTICQGDSTLWYTQYYKETGVYTRDSMNTCGTPVVSTLHLRVLSPSLAPTVDTAICAADTAAFVWRGQSYVAGKTIYTDTAYYEAGCDSVYYELHLRVLSLSLAPTVDTAICAMDTAAFVWRGQSYVTGKTTYTDTAYYEMGCDSVYYELHLTVLSPSLAPAVDTAICAMDTAAFVWRGQSYVAGKTTYTDTAYYEMGCDSVYYELHLRVLSPSLAPTVDTAICAMDTAAFVWRGQSYVAGKTTYTDTAYYEAGCDSVYYELHLRVLSPSLAPTVDTAICAADTAAFVWRGQSYVTGKTIYTDTAYYETGCDSVYYSLHLTVHPSAEIQFADTTCPAKPYIWQGDTLTVTGEYTKILQTIHGCDSVVTLHLVVETPNPDLYPAMDKLPASNKFNAWLLMIDKAAVEDTYHLNPQEADVTWYRVVGEVDSQKEGAIKDDEQVGQGYYYTDDRSLQDAYYALINLPASATADGCGAIYRSMVLNAPAAANALQLIPTRVAANGELQLKNIDQSATTIQVYTATGQLVETIETENNHIMTLQAVGSAGMYLVKVKNAQQDATLKYIVGQ